MRIQIQQEDAVTGSGSFFSSPAAADVDAATTTMAAIPTAGSF